MDKHSIFSGFLAAALALGWASDAAAAQRGARAAYSGSNMECLVGNDFYAVHFTAIQPGRQKDERTDFAKYCQEVPTVGKTYLSIDLLDRDVRKTPVALKVVEEEFNEDDGRPAKELRTVTELPAKIYNNGVADIAADITQPGHYALIATIGEGALSEDDHLRIPFTVGLEGAAKVNWLGRFTGFLVTAFFGTFAVIAYRTYRAYRPKRPVEAEVPVVAKVEAGNAG
jgi:hypothetical protein